MPLRLWRPSQFWLIRHLRKPLFCNSTKAMCVGVGIACRAVVASKLSSRPCARSVQAPSGPLKSGIPADVETPAPVKAMKCLPFLICVARSLASRSTTSGGSKRSTSAILGAVKAMVAQSEVEINQREERERLRSISCYAVDVSTAAFYLKSNSRCTI